MLAAAELLGGLGLLFVGLRLLGFHLQQTTGRRMRRILQSATRSAGLGWIAGAAAGAATQSSNAVTVIVGNLVRGGVLSVRASVPVIAGANVGTAVLVFLAAVDFHLVVLYLVALVGLLYQARVDRNPQWRDWTGAGLGLALLFLGLDFIKGAPAQLPAEVLGGLLDGGLGLIAAFAVGLVVATITQSASTATILAVAAIQTGVLGLGDGVSIVLGANVGSGVALWLTAGDLTGSGRQLCLAQVAIKLAGSTLVALAGGGVLLAPEALAASGLGAVAEARPAFALSVLFLVLQVVGGLCVGLARDRCGVVLARLCPPSIEERASRPRYIHERALEDPLNAIELATLERNRLVGLLPEVLPDLDRGHDDAPARRARHQGALAVLAETEAFAVELIDQHLQREDLDVALRLQASLGALRQLQLTLHDFAETVQGFAADRPPLVFTLSESLRTLTMLLADAVAHAAADPADFATLAELTGDRGELLERLRRDLAGSRYDPELIRRLLLVAALFERAVWLLGRLSAATAPGIEPAQAGLGEAVLQGR